MAPHRRSTRRERSSKGRGGCFSPGGPKRIFRRGAINKHGRQRSIGGLTAGNACRTIGGRHSMSDGGWYRLFDEPVHLPDGGELRTFLEAGRYLEALPKSQHEQPEWQT